MLVDEFSDGVLDELNRLADCADKQSLYVLLDGAHVPGLYRHFVHELGDESVHLLFDDLPSVTEEILAVSPFIFKHSGDRPTVTELLSKCSGLPMLSAIASPEPVELLAERLATWTIVASDGARFNFRFADTRRLPAILQTLSEEQLGAMVGAASAWHYIDRQGKWCTRILPGIAKPLGMRPQLLDSRQFATLADDGEADALLARLRQARYSFEGQPSRQYECVAVALEAAAACGMDRSEIFGWLLANDQRPSGTTANVSMDTLLTNLAVLRQRDEQKGT